VIAALLVTVRSRWSTQRVEQGRHGPTSSCVSSRLTISATGTLAGNGRFFDWQPPCLARAIASPLVTKQTTPRPYYDPSSAWQEGRGGKQPPQELLTLGRLPQLTDVEPKTDG